MVPGKGTLIVCPLAISFLSLFCNRSFILVYCFIIFDCLKIREQWRQEIERHCIPGVLSVRYLLVFLYQFILFNFIINYDVFNRVYHGVRFGDNITPRELAKFDIVLTTYDVLRTEVTFYSFLIL